MTYLRQFSLWVIRRTSLHHFTIVSILLNHYLLRGGNTASSLYDAGYYGYYWSSTLVSSSVAYVLYFYSGGIRTYGDYRYYGFSVRCVAAG